MSEQGGGGEEGGGARNHLAADVSIERCIHRVSAGVVLHVHDHNLRGRHWARMMRVVGGGAHRSCVLARHCFPIPH
jgi:hypothetical protein